MQRYIIKLIVCNQVDCWRCKHWLLKGKIFLIQCREKYNPNNSLKIHVIKLFIWTRYCASYAKPIMVINATHYLWFSHNVCINQKSLITYWKNQQVLFLTVKHLQFSFTFVLGNSAFLGIKYQIYSLNTCKHKFYFYKYSTETTPNCSSYKNSSIYSHTQRGEMNVNCPITINKSGKKAFENRKWFHVGKRDE